MHMVLFLCFVAATKAVPHPWYKLKPAEQHPTDHVLRYMDDDTMTREWSDFKTKYNKEYGSTQEEAKRQHTFETNLKTIEMHNYLYDKGIKSFKLGINQFSDMEESEIAATMYGFVPTNTTTEDTASAHIDYLSPLVAMSLPDEVDWRQKGYVIAVKDQGRCGSCWAFSTTGSLEGQHFRKTGKLVSLSEQNLVDCSTKNEGCKGGNVFLAFQYIKYNGGLDTEQSYPYIAKNGSCKFQASSVGATLTGYVSLPTGNESKLKEAVASVGPVSVAIEASSTFMQYKSGVYDDPSCGVSLNHAVLVVGYGNEDGKDYWLVKNSWGASWGMQGYIKMARNKKNQCGIATSAGYPLV